jgi:phosphoribosylformylglycinamidine synthase subunit PurL
LPTPAIGGVGVLEDVSKMATIAFKNEGDAIFVVGDNDGHLGQSLWLREIGGREAGPAPKVDLAKERTHGEFIRKLIDEGKVNAVHDVADGGMLVALTEMALASGKGCNLEQIGDAFTAFGEDQARYIVASAAADTIQAAGIPMTRVGTVGGDSVAGPGFKVPLTDIRAAHESFFKNWMEA